MSGQRPKRFRRAQLLATLNLLHEKDLGGSDAKDQENASDWELSVSEEELSSEDEIKMLQIFLPQMMQLVFL